MRRALAIALLLAVPAAAQTRRPPLKKPAAPPPAAAAVKNIAPEISCPTPLGEGVRTKLAFCEVMAERDPAKGVVIQVPPHRGAATLTFDLHNLHTYSEELVRQKKAFTRYTATIGVMTMDNTLISRAVVQNEFRSASDLVDRVGGGAGPGGVKAVAPTGTESVTVTIPESEGQVSLLGEKLSVERMEGPATYSQPGRPIAVVSKLMLEYHPAPPRPMRKGK